LLDRVTDHDLGVQSRRKGGQLAVQDALRIPSYRIVVMSPSAGSSGPRPSGDHAGLKAASGMWPVVVRARNDAVGATARTVPPFKPIPPLLGLMTHRLAVLGGSSAAELLEIVGLDLTPVLGSPRAAFPHRVRVRLAPGRSHRPVPAPR
jgi:hypothetical protein